MTKIAILSHVVVDEIRNPGQMSLREQIGGAGAYAAVGASLAGNADEAVIISGVGRTDRPMIERWARSRGIDTRGLFDTGAHSPRTRIEYFDDGERAETPMFGQDHFDAHTPLPRHVPGDIDDLCGAYLFHAHELPYWTETAAWRPGLPGPLLWEISRDSCRPHHLARVREIAATIDVLSINLTEARQLLECNDPELPDALADLAPAVVLRSGASGSLVIHGSDRIEVPAIRVVVADPTGGGNGYSGAFLTAYATTGDLETAGRTAAAVAAAVVSTAGTPTVDNNARAAVSIAAAALSITVTRKAST